MRLSNCYRRMSSSQQLVNIIELHTRPSRELLTLQEGENLEKPSVIDAESWLRLNEELRIGAVAWLEASDRMGIFLAPNFFVSCCTPSARATLCCSLLFSISHHIKRPST